MSVLDQYIKYTIVPREVYGNDYNNKPNNHCNWVNEGCYTEMFVWEENDNHYRNRLNTLLKEK